jgi:hypothetical protein
MNGDRRSETRHHSRARISWPVTVKGDRSLFEMQTVDVSPVGAKVRPYQPLEPGTMVVLNFHPPEAEAVDVRAMVWRTDADGLVFFFLGGRVGDLLLAAHPF